MKEQLEKELDEMTLLYSQLSSDVFQRNIVAKIQSELDELKPAYKCESLREMATLKGKANALEKVLNLIDSEAIGQKVIYLRSEISKLEGSSS